MMDKDDKFLVSAGYTMDKELVDCLYNLVKQVMIKFGKALLEDIDSTKSNSCREVFTPNSEVRLYGG
jgi:malic enzyme